MWTQTRQRMARGRSAASWQFLGIGALLVLWLAGHATGEPVQLTDAELDNVHARGATDEEGAPVLDLGGILASAAAGGNGALFAFDLGNVFGNGSVDLGQLMGPSTLTLNGNLNTQALYVENLIFNLNICAGCSGEVYQTGLGVPINIQQTGSH